ncbi:MAG TPA: hypothetical protein VFQ54_02815, partial [Thermomicrobiales bacterium]|nr:hypothetical protein [Thermomicrobiales bacterium]
MVVPGSYGSLSAPDVAAQVSNHVTGLTLQCNPPGWPYGQATLYVEKPSGAPIEVDVYIGPSATGPWQAAPSSTVYVTTNSGPYFEAYNFQVAIPSSGRNYIQTDVEGYESSGNIFGPCPSNDIPTPTPTPTKIPTATPTHTPSPVPTNTPTSTPTDTPTPVPTSTPTPVPTSTT